jgi:DNA-binding LytR/AlgR family response regulator
MNILICDDDAAFASKCMMKLVALAAKHGIFVTFDIVESGKKLLFYKDTKYAKVDLIYMDYHLEDMNGIETAQKLRESGVTADIVFCTRDESHMQEGYDVDALHYLLKNKPEEAKFERAFLKAVKNYQNRNRENISLSFGRECRNVPIRDILYFEVRGRVVTIHYYKNEKIETFEFYSSLSKIEELLDGKGFLRIHASYLVAEQYIYRETQKEIEMQDGAIIPVGKKYRCLNKLKEVGREIVQQVEQFTARREVTVRL